MQAKLYSLRNTYLQMLRPYGGIILHSIGDIGKCLRR